MTFDSLKDLAKKAYSIKDKRESLIVLRQYTKEYLDYFESKYPEIFDIIKVSYPILNKFNSEEEFIRTLIINYDVDIVDLLNLNYSKLVSAYIKSKNV